MTVAPSFITARAHTVWRAWAMASALCMLAGTALAQSQGGDKPSEAKARLVERVLTLWHPEELAIVMVQRPAADALQQARIALQGRVSAEKRDATLKDMASDVQKYLDEATPVARENAKRAMATTVVPMLNQHFSEDELKQLITLLESPLKKKFEQLLPQMERALGEKVAQDSRAAIDPKLQAMTHAVGLKLRGATVAP